MKGWKSVACCRAFPQLPNSCSPAAAFFRGNLLSTFNGTVTVALASNPGGATLGGTLTATASNGVATFSGLSLTTAASGYTLGVSASGLGGATTTAITVTPAAPSELAITEEPPASVTARGGFGLQATIEDAYGNVETGDNAAVTVALANKKRVLGT